MSVLLFRDELVDLQRRSQDFHKGVILNGGRGQVSKKHQKLSKMKYFQPVRGDKSPISPGYVPGDLFWALK